MMFTKYHRMGRTLGVAAGPNLVAFFSKIKLKVEKGFANFVWMYSDGNEYYTLSCGMYLFISMCL